MEGSPRHYVGGGDFARGANRAHRLSSVEERDVPSVLGVHRSMHTGIISVSKGLGLTLP